MIQDAIRSVFKENFSGEPIIIRSPGRINLIGEHTDYNDGFVLPAAIDKAVYLAIGPRQDDELHLFAADFNELYSCTLNEIKPLNHHWANYVLGVASQMMQRSLPVKGFNAVIVSDLPIGAGISSSAALECAVAFGLNELFQLGMEKLNMVKLAQQAEHQFAGVKCGIMDMFASMMGKKDHCIRLDCRSLEYTYEPLQLNEYVLVLLNTNVKHSLASSAYNERRLQCEQGVAWVQEYHPEIKSLRDATAEMLEKYVLPKDTVIYRRCRFVVDENNRLLEACTDLEKGHLEEMGKKMFATHEGLSKEYEVSCRELDYLVNRVKEYPEVIGARMMGGGFGGCTINIIRKTAVERITADLEKRYTADMNLPFTVIQVTPSDGTSVISFS